MTTNETNASDGVTVKGKLAIVVTEPDGRTQIHCEGHRDLLLNDEGNWESYRGQNKSWPTLKAAEQFLEEKRDKPAPVEPADEQRCIECGGKGYVLDYDRDDDTDFAAKIPCSTCRPMTPPAAQPTEPGERELPPNRPLFQSLGIVKCSNGNNAVFQCTGCSNQVRVPYEEYLAGKFNRLHEYVIVKFEDLAATPDAALIAENERLRKHADETIEALLNRIRSAPHNGKVYQADDVEYMFALGEKLDRGYATGFNANWFRDQGRLIRATLAQLAAVTQERDRLKAAALPYVEAVILDLEDEVDRDMEHTEAQRSIQKQIHEARTFAAALSSEDKPAFAHYYQLDILGDCGWEPLSEAIDNCDPKEWFDGAKVYHTHQAMRLVEVTKKVLHERAAFSPEKST